MLNVQQPLFPPLGCEGQFVEFGSRFSPGRVVFVEDFKETVVMGRFQEVGHFVSDDVFEKMLGFLG